MSILIEFQYFPNVSVISALIQHKHVVFEAYETYQKGGFRNRCEVTGSNGRLELRIPLVGGRTQKALISEVKLDFRENWQQAHYRSLVACYRRSPFFEHYADSLIELYTSKYSWLVDWDLACLDWLRSVLKLDFTMDKTTAYLRSTDPARQQDFRNLSTPRQRLLPGTRVVPYDQVFADRMGFTPALSILDLLFCTGPGAETILQSMVSE